MPRLLRGKCGKVIYRTELDAKLALLNRQNRDKGQLRIHRCNVCKGKVYHLTSQRRKRAEGKRDPQDIDGESRPAIASTIR
jgi:hypothetical protein